METILINIQVSDVAQKLSNTTQKINELKAANKQLTKEIKLGNDENGKNSAALAKNEAQLKLLTATEKTYKGQIAAATNENRNFGNSLTEQRAKLSDLKNQYKSLSEEQRSSDAGKTMLKNITVLDNKVKENAQSIGDWQDNVGHYENAARGFGDVLSSLGGNFGKIGNFLTGSMQKMGGFQKNVVAMTTTVSGSGAGLNNFSTSAKNMTKDISSTEGAVGSLGKNVAGGLVGSFKTAAAQAVKFGKVLLTTPIGWIVAIIAVLVAIIGKLKEAFDKSDDSSTRLSQAFSIFKPVLNAISAIFVKLAEILSKLILGFANLAAKIIGTLVPAYKEQQKAAEDLVIAEDKLEDLNREHIVNSAARAAKIAKLNKESRDDSKYTAREREKMLQEADDLEKKDLEEKKKIAAENLRIIKAKAKEEKDTSDATKDKIAEATAALYNAEAEYYQGTTRLASRHNDAMKEIAAEEAQRQKEQIEKIKELQEKRKEAAKNELDISRQLKSALIDVIKDEVDRNIAQIENESKVYIQDLQERIRTESTLTKKAKEDIRKLIVLKEKETVEAVKKIKDAADEEKLKEEVANEQQRLANENEIERDALKDNAVMLAELEVSIARAKLKELDSLRDNANNKEYSSEVEKNKAILAADAAFIEQKKKISELELNAQKVSDEKITNAYKNELDKRLYLLRQQAEKSETSELKRAKANNTVAKESLQSLTKIDAKTKKAMYKNEDDYKDAIFKANQDVIKSEAAVTQAQQQMASEIAETFSSVTSAMSDVFQAISNDSEKYAKFQKALAIANSIIKLGEAVASAVAMSTAGDPYTMAIRIAVNVASVTAAIASVISSIKAAVVPEAGSYAVGGIVPGTSFYGDKIRANVNSGEMILTREQQRNLFNLMNVNNISNSIDYNIIAKAVVAGMKASPAPVLNYKEFVTFQKRVQLSDKAIKL